MTEQDRRLDYRVHYPMHLHPELKIYGRSLAVLDVSENGVRFSRSAGLQLGTGDQLAAQLIFPEGEACSIKGRVIRVAEDSIALHLEQGIGFHTILSQRDLVQCEVH